MLNLPVVEYVLAGGALRIERRGGLLDSDQKSDKRENATPCLD